MNKNVIIKYWPIIAILWGMIGSSIIKFIYRSAMTQFITEQYFTYLLILSLILLIFYYRIKNSFEKGKDLNQWRLYLILGVFPSAMTLYSYALFHRFIIPWLLILLGIGTSTISIISILLMIKTFNHRLEQ